MYVSITYYNTLLIYFIISTDIERVLNYVFSNAVEGDADSVIRAIEEYDCKYGTMIVGNIKGTEIDKLILEREPKVQF